MSVAYPHYLTTEQLCCIFFGGGYAATNPLNIGGVKSTMNAVTSIAFFTAANNVTTSGTARMKIDSDGGIFMYGLKSGANQGAAGAAANELWIDTADQSFKLGV